MLRTMDEFRQLMLVCLKMLFRKSTRKRFVCLVLGFLLMMGLNTFFFLQRHHAVEMEKRRLLTEKAFKVFFLRARSRADAHRLVHRHGPEIDRMGGRIVNEAFIYQNNLFLHFDEPAAGGPRTGAPGLLDALFGTEAFAAALFGESPDPGGMIRMRNAYMDYNGSGLSPSIASQRQDEIVRDLRDMADMIRAGLSGRRMMVFNDSVNRVTGRLERVLPQGAPPPNPYLSRVEAVVPVNWLYPFSHLRDDVTTDIVDLGEAIRTVDGRMETFEDYLAVPEDQTKGPRYIDIDAYPRYIPVFAPNLLTQGWHWMLFHDLRLDRALMAFFDGRHFKGNLLFSYEKTRILQNRTDRINQELRWNQANFYVTDLTMGIAFPFMVSLFAFIHLKTELAFLLMFKNRIRSLLWIFWLLPLVLVAAAKGGVTAGFMVYAQSGGAAMDGVFVLPLLISFVAAAAIFFPINRWCFSSFTGDNLCLYELHKGR